MQCVADLSGVMSFSIEAVGAVTPLGPTSEATWQALCEGQMATRSPLSGALREPPYLCCSVPAKYLNEAARFPRLRRSSSISLMGVTAAQEALSSAIPPDKRKMALVYSICSGVVSYTRRFFDEVLSLEAAPSPLLFSETVFNGPASHLAALLQIDGAVYTLVGDSAVGLSAIHFAIELLTMRPDLEHCLVVGTEEMNWVLPEAFHSWRMVSATGECAVYRSPAGGTVFGEAGAAVLIGRRPGFSLAFTTAGQTFFSIRDAIARTGEVIRQAVTAAGRPDLIIASANGTFADAAESSAFAASRMTGPVYTHKPALGDALGASAVLQLVLGCLALRHQTLPGTMSQGGKLPLLNRETKAISAERCLISAVGFSQQANAVVIEKGG
jgi:3-oxoacyl-(acyl-carrier-protein) synthase